jgi:hypothetical protein
LFPAKIKQEIAGILRVLHDGERLELRDFSLVPAMSIVETVAARTNVLFRQTN